MPKLKELLELLKKINIDDRGDTESCHIRKDKALLDYINDKNIESEFNKGERWYA